MKRRSRAEYLAEGILMILWSVVLLIVTLLLRKRYGYDMGFMLFLIVVLLGLGGHSIYRWFRYDKTKWSEEDLRILTRKECRNAVLGDVFVLLIWVLNLWIRLDTFRPFEDDVVMNIFLVAAYGGLVLLWGQRTVFDWLKYIRAGEQDDLPAGTN